MFELTMTTHTRDQRPTIISEEREDITNLHISNMIGEWIENRKPNGGVDAAARFKAASAPPS